MISTCSLVLVLDVVDLDLIQQEGDFPSVSSYVQRIGRTGRRIPPQRCYAHVSDEFDFLKNLAVMTLAEEGYVEDNPLPRNLYHLLLQQLLMLALGSYGYTVQEARTRVRRCAALAEKSDAEFDEVLTHWIAHGVLRVSDGLLLIGPEVERRHSQTNYRDLYVLFDSPQIFEVWHGRTAIGTLDLLFVHTQREKFVFILAGKWWQVEEICRNEGVVYVEPFSTVPPPATWISPRGREVSYQLAQQIKDLLLAEDFAPCLKQPAARIFLAGLRDRARAEGLVKTPVQYHLRSDNSCEVVTYAGDRVNLLVTALARKLKKWVCEDKDVSYASFRVRAELQSLKDFEDAFGQLIKQIKDDKALGDISLLTELAAAFDDEDASKWSAWLPAKYRQRFLARQVYDTPSTELWLESLQY